MPSGISSLSSVTVPTNPLTLVTAEVTLTAAGVMFSTTKSGSSITVTARLRSSVGNVV